MNNVLFSKQQVGSAEWSLQNANAKLRLKKMKMKAMMVQKGEEEEEERIIEDSNEFSFGLNFSVNRSEIRVSIRQSDKSNGEIRERTIANNNNDQSLVRRRINNNNQLISGQILLKPVVKNTIKMCHLSFILLLILSTNYITSASSADQKTFSEESISDEAIIMPAYTPTRTPNSSPQQRVAATAGAKKRQLDLDSKASSGSKFTRTNELDVFLDDINHSELRALASGKPIDSFRPKAMMGVSAGDEKHESGGSQKKESSESDKQPATSSLDGSGSEQQIYSECALILQRTYVKNINDPK